MYGRFYQTTVFGVTVPTGTADRLICDWIVNTACCAIAMAKELLLRVDRIRQN